MREMDQAAPTESRRAGTLPRAFLIGLFVGATAQFLRQIVGPLMAVGGGIAPWVTIGFILAIWETRGRPFRRASLLGVKTIAAYLLAWLLSYHGLFAVRESVGVFAAWREALPWLVIAGPMSVSLGLAAARSHKPGTLGDVCLALPLAWSLPEITESWQRGWWYSATVAIPIGILALLPFVAAARRGVDLVKALLAAVTLGLVAVALLPLMLSYIHS
jgi:hypothetical protein